MKAIETRYKGYRFRSRLEARWAVFFDSLGIEWQYEPEGFEKEDSEGFIYRWLPDFYLPHSETWVEVKGGKIADCDAQKMAFMLDFGSPLDGIDEGGCDCYNGCVVGLKKGEKYPVNKKARGLLVLNEIPDPHAIKTEYLFISHCKGLHKKFASFSVLSRSVFISISETIEVFDYWDHDELFTQKEKQSLYSGIVFADIRKASIAARSARFEHGDGR
jgi:hypothetical protein